MAKIERQARMAAAFRLGTVAPLTATIEISTSQLQRDIFDSLAPEARERIVTELRHELARLAMAEYQKTHETIDIW
mgnify:CR=1 FL=1